MPEPALHPVAHDGRAHRAADHESDFGGTVSGGVRKYVHNKARPPGFGATADGRREVLAGAHAMDRGQQERLRPTALRDPCGDGSPGWRGRRASACAGGSRACGHDGGCSAGTYACSRVVPHAGGGSQLRRPLRVRMGTSPGCRCHRGKRAVDGHRSFTDLRPVNTRRMSRKTDRHNGTGGPVTGQTDSRTRQHAECPDDTPTSR